MDKNTELRKREFQQGIENLQAKHPLEVNQTLSKLYEILPTSQLNLIDNDGYQRKKFNPKLNIFNFKVNNNNVLNNSFVFSLANELIDFGLISDKDKEILTNILIKTLIPSH